MVLEPGLEPVLEPVLEPGQVLVPVLGLVPVLEPGLVREQERHKQPIS